ncbi:hypothetical protein MSG28_001504 [Choristoneura fumiferana]|uniref:Uncharacterized protein n=2 Tax=Choristoneura fumiferana TaxID=7141 RepID=A0ACC0KUW3_CHOFU|nr:hypothetical protein MSG28_001504 [Choristoneura fumiferana]KAI8440082.1 hypothetical protein MSG28_001504 [Choristoneura fumiferana]
MSRAARELKFTKDFIERPRRSREIPTENILLLQEMAFVRHRKVIRIHMAEVKWKEEDEFNALKASGGFWTCECCYDEECIPSKDGRPDEFPKELNDRYKKCLDILNISDVHRKLVSPFTVFGFDLFHAGSCNSKYGVAVGIPVNFTYKSVSYLENMDIKVNQNNIDWTSETGQKLANALILPEDVQQFAICREILMTQTIKSNLKVHIPLLHIFCVQCNSIFKQKVKSVCSACSCERYPLFNCWSLRPWHILSFKGHRQRSLL